MFEQLLMFLAGFITAYLVVRAIRSFRSTVGVLALGVLMCGKAEAINIYMSNSTAATIYFKIYSTIGTNRQLWSQNFIIANNHAGTYPYTSGNIPIDLEWYSDSGKTVLVGREGPTSIDAYWTYDGPDQQNYTNYPGQITCTNSQPLSVIYALLIYESGQIVDSSNPILPAHGTYDSGVIYRQNPWTWTMTPIIDTEGHDYSCAGTATTPEVGTNNIPDQNPEGDGSNPTGNPNKNKYPEIDDGGETNNIANDNRNVQAILDALGIINSKLYDYRPWLNTTTNLLGQINDKTFDYREYWKTNNNQGKAATNLLTSVTNLLTTANQTAGGSSNILVASTNYLSAISNQTRILDSNSVGGSWSNNMSSESNTAWSDQVALYSQSGMSGLTNFTWQNAATNVTEPELDMSFTLGTVKGVTHKIDFNYANHLDSSLVSDTWKLVGWGSVWFAWIINLALWLAVMYRIDELMHETRGYLLNQGKVNTGATLGGWLAKATIQATVTTAFTAMLIVLPTMLVTWTSTNVSNPLTGGTPITDVQNNYMNVSSIVWKMICHWTNIILNAIPFGVMVTALMNWLVFFQYSRAIATGVQNVIWRWQKLIPVIIILWCVGGTSVEATQIRFENLSGQGVVISNASTIMNFDAGITRMENLDPGEWTCGSQTLTVPSDGAYVVRVTMDRSSPQLKWETGTEYSMVDWFLIGLQSGFGIFGSAWAVSAMWQGWQLRHGGSTV